MGFGVCGLGLRFSLVLGLVLGLGFEVCGLSLGLGFGVWGFG